MKNLIQLNDSNNHILINSLTQNVQGNKAAAE